jgi:hypothetical protein
MDSMALSSGLRLHKPTGTISISYSTERGDHHESELRHIDQSERVTWRTSVETDNQPSKVRYDGQVSMERRKRDAKQEDASSLG